MSKTEDGGSFEKMVSRCEENMAAGMEENDAARTVCPWSCYNLMLGRLSDSSRTGCSNGQISRQCMIVRLFTLSNAIHHD